MNFGQESGMTVRMDIQEVLKALRANRVTHNENWANAKTLWRKECIAKMRKNLKQAEDGGKIETSFHVVAPVRYDQAYADAIDMLSYSLDASIQLTAREFQSYIKDKWDWSGAFVANTMSYMSAGSVSADPDDDDD